MRQSELTWKGVTEKVKLPPELEQAAVEAHNWNVLWQMLTEATPKYWLSESATGQKRNLTILRNITVMSVYSCELTNFPL
jgi:hypothetical protein